MSKPSVDVLTAVVAGVLFLVPAVGGVSHPANASAGSLGRGGAPLLEHSVASSESPRVAATLPEFRGSANSRGEPGGSVAAPSRAATPLAGPPIPGPPSTIAVGTLPSGAVYDDRNGLVYVENLGSDNVSVINGSAVIASITVGINPSTGVFDSANGWMYVVNSGANFGTHNVSVINGTRLIGAINVGISPVSATYDPANGYVYVANQGSDNVTVIDGMAVAGTVALANEPDSAAYDPGDGDVYVASANSSFVSVINGTALVAKVAVGVPSLSFGWSVIYDGEDDDIYVANGGSGNVSVIHGTSVVGAVGTGSVPESLTYDPGNGFVYVSARDNVTIIHDLSVVGSVSVGLGPDSATYDPGDGEVYVPNAQTGDLTVINGTAAVALVRIGSDPSAATYDGGTGSVYVPNAASNNVSVLPPGVGYTVTFNETGLPIATTWSVAVGSVKGFSNAPTITFDETNGSHAYALGGVAGWTTESFGGTFLVPGAPALVEIAWSPTTYLVTFEETGLPAGTEWWANVSGAPSATGTTSNLSVPLPNGTFAYGISTTNRSWAAPGGTLTVSAAARPEYVVFVPVTYSVTFIESGLPPGTGWYVTLAGSTSFGGGTTQTFSDLSNGTYPFTIRSVAGYTAQPGAGSISIQGSSVNVSILFLATMSPAPGVPPYVWVAVLGGIVGGAVVLSVFLLARYLRRATTGLVTPPAEPNFEPGRRRSCHLAARSPGGPSVPYPEYPSVVHRTLAPP